MEALEACEMPGDLHYLLERSPVLFVMMDLTQAPATFHWVSPNVESLLGYSQAESCAENWWFRQVHPEDRKQMAQQFQQSLIEGADRVLGFRFKTQSGEYRKIQNHIHFPPSKDRQDTGTIYQIWHDITQQDWVTTRIQSLQRAYALLTGANEAALSNNSLDDLYQALCDLAVIEGQYQLAWVGLIDNATGEIWPVAQAGQDDGYVHTVCATITAEKAEGRGPVGQAIREGQPVIAGDIQNDPCMGPWRARALARGYRSLIALPIRSGNAVIGAFVMYSDEKQRFTPEEKEVLIQLSNDLSVGIESLHERQLREAAEKKLHQLAFYDELTGLPKVSYLRELIAAEPETMRHGACCMILQLARFSEFNHVFGYEAGDQILSTVAERLREYVSEGYHVVRIAGAKFLILGFRCRSESQLRELAERILKQMREPITIHGVPLETPAHVGIAIAGPDASFETMFRNADMARVYSAEHKLPFAKYEPAMEIDPGRLQLISELRNAVEQKQLVLQYQPKLDLEQSVVHGAEALVRWQHPKRGMVPPGDFIEIAEQTGLITNITLFVVQQGIHDAMVLTERGQPLNIAVNVSAADIRNPHFASYVLRSLEQKDMMPECLSLELTETTIMQDAEQCQETLALLRDAGVQTAVDDFGTGYSSLTYLANMPLHSLKIDRSFVRGIQEVERSRMIVKSTIDMASSLGLRTTAEGVERIEWLSELKRLGCNEGQGYGIAKPMALHALMHWLDGQNHRVWL